MKTLSSFKLELNLEKLSLDRKEGVPSRTGHRPKAARAPFRATVAVIAVSRVPAIRLRRAPRRLAMSSCIFMSNACRDINAK
jgi:hypothetical protein